MGARLSIFNPELKEVQGVIAAMQGFDKETNTQLRKATRDVIGPAWQQEIGSRVSTPLERRVVGDTARVTVSNQNVVLKVAQVGRKLPGGAKPADIVGPVVWGANKGKTKTYRQSARRGGAAHEVKNRHTQRQFKPFRGKAGYVVYPAASSVIPRLTSLWVQTVVRTFYDLTERR